MTTATSAQIIDRLVQRAQRLYSLPAVAMKVVELTDQPKVNTAALRDCVEKDPALTAKILRVVNSSLFGLTRKVNDLKQGIALLGTKPLKLLVLGFSLPDNLLSGLESEALSRYWRHTLIKAVAARQISEQLLQTPGDDAFLAGLLQEIGVLVLIQDLGEPYVQFLQGVEREGADLAELEVSTLGFDHALLSARLLESWGLPQNLVEAIGMPNDELRTLNLDEEQRPLVQSLHLAELVARFLTSGCAELLDDILAVGKLYCELTRERLELLVGSLEEQVAQLAEILALELPGDPEYTRLLAAAYKQLAEVAEDAAEDMACSASLPLEGEQKKLTECVERFAGTPMYSDQADVPLDSPSAGDPSIPSTVSPSKASRAEVTVTQKRELTLEPSLTVHVSAAVTACRQARCGLSLLLVEVDDFSTHMLMRGLDGAEQLVRHLRSVIDRTHGGDGRVVILNEIRFAVLLPSYERQAAVELARNLVSNVRSWSLEEAQRGNPAISISAGLATLAMPPKNFPADELVEAAERCLNGVQLSGGDSVKSIDIC